MARVKAGEFIAKIRKLGKTRGVPVRFDKKRGKGSHGTLYYGGLKTIVKDRRTEPSPGLRNAMLKQLGLTKRDIE